jgi:IclR family transcriptional regulator, KDG regulon repressor
MPESYIVQPIARALRVLEYVALEGRELTLTEIHTRLKLPKTTCFRYLQTLRAAGLIDYDPVSDRYRSGEKLARLSASPDRSPLVTAALPTMRALRDRFNETVNLAELIDKDVVYREIVESRRSLRMQARIGAHDPAHTTSLGKALLASLPPERLLQHLPARLTARTDDTLTTLAALHRELRLARERGWASDHAENEDGTWCVGVALGSSAALSLSAPASRMNGTLEREMGEALILATREILPRTTEPGR